MKVNVLAVKSFNFSIRILKLVSYLNNNKSSIVISNQILRSGTSIGASITESEFAASNKDFINKLTVSLKEANETRYWLKLLNAAEFINQKMFDSLNIDCEELIKLLVSSIKTSKSNKST